MKARIKETGEIVNLASYATITLDQCDSWGNPIEMKPEEVELIQEVTEDEHWQDVREKAAIAALGGLLANTNKIGGEDVFTKVAVDFANALVKRLKEAKL
jgi:hypothetical protein